MPSHSSTLSRRRGRDRRHLRPCLCPLEPRVVPSLTFPGIAGITFDTSGDIFVSYDSSTEYSGQQQSVAEVGANGFLVSADVFGTKGSSALPGTLTTIGSSASLPDIDSAGDILELQPNGQLFVFDPVGGGSSQYDDLANDTPNASKVYDVQTGTSVNLSNQISLKGATYGDFGIYNNSLVVSAESNSWDFVMRVTYGSTGASATVLVASPASDGLGASPEGVAVDSQGTVLTTLPYVPTGSSTATHVPVGFNLFYDTGNGPAPYVPMLGLSTVPNIDSGGITVDSQNNFILAMTDSSLYGGGPGIAHINSSLTAFLADPTESGEAIPAGIAYQDVGGTNYLVYTDTAADTYTLGYELPLFSGQVSPAQLRNAYGIDQISFTAPNGTTVTGDGAGQTIAIVEEGVDPTLGADLTTFDQFYGIPAPPSFKVVDQNGVTTQNVDIVGEASLDVEWAHAIAPGASIIVYNSAYEPNDATASFANLLEAMQQASQLPGVSVVTLSYGEPESTIAAAGLNEESFDADFTTPGVTFLAAAGDSGIYGDGGRAVAANYPTASPNIVSVGGTSIVIDSAGDYPGTGTSGEVAWGDGTASGAANSGGGGGGGLSTVEPEPSWQSAFIPANIDSVDARALPDVAMDSGSAQEYDVFTSTLAGSSDSAAAVGWLGDAGTSAASPIWAGLIAIADQGRVLAGGTPLTGYTQTLPALYSLPRSDYHDIIYGNNGDPAGPGYDLATGLGTPVANLLVPDLASYEIGSKMQVKTQPPSSVAAGGTFGLTVEVEDRFGNPATGGAVTVALGNNPADATLGGTLSVPVIDGVATFSGLSLNQIGSDYTLKITGSGISGTLITSDIAVTSVASATRVVVTQSPAAPTFGEAVTLFVDVSVVGASNGTPSGTVTFSDGSTTLGSATLTGGTAVFSTTLLAAGTHTITITYGGDTDDQPSSVMLPLNIAQATPTLTWANPANIIAGTQLGAAQLDATASYDGTPVAGVFTYTPAAGTILPGGSDQALTVSFAPTDDTDFTTVTAFVTINVLPQSTQTPAPSNAMVIGEQPVFERKLNKRGKPVGKPFLAGFKLDFNLPLSVAAASDPSNYEIDRVTTKKAKKTLDRILQPVSGVAVTYEPAKNYVLLTLSNRQTFPKGGQITVLPGVANASGAALFGITEFSITPGGTNIKPS